MKGENYMFNTIKEAIVDHPIITTVLLLTVVGIPVLATWIWWRNR